MKRIPRLARIMSWTTKVTMGLIIAGFAFIWLNYRDFPDLLGQQLHGIANPEIPAPMLFGGFVLSSLLVIVLFYGLFQVVRFFDLYKDGVLFPVGAGSRLARFGTALACLAPLKIVVFAASSVMFSLHLPHGERQLAVNINSDELLLLIVGGLIFMVGHLLNSADAVVEENRRFV